MEDQYFSSNFVSDKFVTCDKNRALIQNALTLYNSISQPKITSIINYIIISTVWIIVAKKKQHSNSLNLVDKVLFLFSHGLTLLVFDIFSNFFRMSEWKKFHCPKDNNIFTRI